MIVSIAKAATMPDTPADNGASAVPSGRLARFARFGSMATGVAGGMIADGARQLAAGKRPSVAQLLLTPANARRITSELANLRGAAMKMGQLLSMDSGELLPPELGQILSRLRADAQAMPVRQLETLLNTEWGRGWRTRFERFDVRPIAAASIGQVHRARTRDGRDLAIKLQYPGVRASIDSDVGNVGALLKLSGLVPASIDTAPLLAEARRQLHEEADYEREAGNLARFGSLLELATDYQVPALHADLTTRNVLAMDFVSGVAIESLAEAPQETRDRVMRLAISLLLRELFEFGLMQTDPNFANFRYNMVSDRLVLLDFGATRAFGAEISAPYRRLLVAGFDGNRAAAEAAMLDIGFFSAEVPANHRATIVSMFETAMAPLRRDGWFDFADRSTVEQIRDEGMTLAADRSVWHIPPIDTLFLQRKFGGIYLLGSRLKARVDMAALLAPYR